jgi:hypothetical protein
MTAAEIIRDQIGAKALYMIGTKMCLHDNDGKTLILKIGRNGKGVNTIKITLNDLDLYDIEFGSARGVSYKVKSTDYNIYFDQLHQTIEEHTGMYTSL